MILIKQVILKLLWIKISAGKHLKSDGGNQED